MDRLPPEDGGGLGLLLELSLTMVFSRDSGVVGFRV